MNADIKNKIETKEFEELFKEFGSEHEKMLNLLEVKEDYLIALGRVVKSFEAITWNLQAFIITINSGQHDQILVSWLSFKGLVGALSSLCEQNNFLPEKIKNLGTLLNNGEEIRNHIIHSAWIRGFGEEDCLHRLKLNKKGLTTEFENFTTDDFNKITEWFDKLNTILEKLVEVYKKEKAVSL